MTTIYHAATNSLLQMDDAALAADAALALSLKHLAQQPHAVALVAEAGAALGYGPKDLAPTITLVRAAQAIRARDIAPDQRLV